MNAHAQAIQEIAHRLLAYPEPIAFLDVLMLVRRARQLGEPSDTDLRSLLALQNAPHTTDGARKILDDYLRGCARRHETQENLGARVIRLKDSGKTARVTAGALLTLELDERRGAGWRWEISSSTGPIQVGRSPKSAESPSFAIYTVKALRKGHAELFMEEEPPPGRPPSSGEKGANFELTVEIESAS